MKSDKRVVWGAGLVFLFIVFTVFVLFPHAEKFKNSQLIPDRLASEHFGDVDASTYTMIYSYAEQHMDRNDFLAWINECPPDFDSYSITAAVTCITEPLPPNERVVCGSAIDAGAAARRFIQNTNLIRLGFGAVGIVSPAETAYYDAQKQLKWCQNALYSLE
ncbi:hypothetical protein KJ765_02655 [Candidatus Micrarchaeota archaeon]|nr:hypothetical protein [Candidatus Micrarchaeota archaeon]